MPNLDNLTMTIDVRGIDEVQELFAQMSAELRSWRWLHWDQPNAPWACRCGGANGHAIDVCPECNTPRPAKGVPLE